MGYSPYELEGRARLAEFEKAVGSLQGVGVGKEGYSFSDRFKRRYSSLTGDRLALGAKTSFAEALSPTQMRSAGGQAKAASVLADTTGTLARERMAGELGLEEKGLELSRAYDTASREWSTTKAGLQRDVLQGGLQMASGIAADRNAAAERKAQKQAGMMSTIGTLAGAAFGAAGNAGSFSTLFAANGTNGQTTQDALVVGDPQRGNAANPEILLNPTRAPIEIIPMSELKNTERFRRGATTLATAMAAKSRQGTVGAVKGGGSGSPMNGMYGFMGGEKSAVRG